MSLKYGFECGSTNDYPSITNGLEQPAIRSLFEVAAFHFTLEKAFKKKKKTVTQR